MVVTYLKQKMSVVSFISGDKYGMVEQKQLEHGNSILRKAEGTRVEM